MRGFVEDCVFFFVFTGDLSRQGFDDVGLRARKKILFHMRAFSCSSGRSFGAEALDMFRASAPNLRPKQTRKYSKKKEMFTDESSTLYPSWLQTPSIYNLPDRFLPAGGRNARVNPGGTRTVLRS